ncbi:MAG: S24/S26 family peptidase [Mucinivorans sp.]
MNAETLSQIAKQASLDEIESRLAANQEVTILIRGWSMRPMLFNLRHHAIICPIQKPLATGDVVVFKYKNRFLIHRIIQIQGENLTIQGDGVPFATEKVTRQDVIGVMREAITPRGKHIKCDSKPWIRKSKRWAAVNPNVKYIVLKFLRLLEILKLI